MEPTRDRFKLSLPFNITLEAAGSVARASLPWLIASTVLLGGIYFIVEQKLSRRLDKAEVTIDRVQSDVSEIKTALYTGRIKVVAQRPHTRATEIASAKLGDPDGSASRNPAQ